jgi:hypothetical protein
MKTELPAQEDYYRLTRARELREKAARLEWWPSARAEKVFVVALCAGPLTVGLLSGAASWQLSLLLHMGLMVAAALNLLRGFRQGRAERCRVEANVLEREHQARYGDVGAGEVN